METLQVGRLLLNDAESRDLEGKPGEIAVEGMLTGAGEKADDVRAIGADISNLVGYMVPVVFGSKVIRNGYYVVQNADVTVSDWPREGVVGVEWELDLALLGYANDVDLESRLGGPLTLNNSHALTGERWHAPPPGHTSYWSGAGVPSQVIRTGSEGPLTVYRDVAIDTNVLWNCDPTLYGTGRVRFLDERGLERSGTSVRTDPAEWELHNTLVRVAPSISSTLLFSVWDDGWKAQEWDLKYNGTALGVPDAVSIVRNDFELMQLRLLWALAPSGRVTADLTLRRGAQYIEIFLKSMQSTTMALAPSDPVASTAGTGFVSASANDADGNRYIVGSPNAYTADTTNGGLSKASTVTLDAFLGSIFGGSGASAGNTGVDVRDQFLGAPTERVIGVRL